MSTEQIIETVNSTLSEEFEVDQALITPDASLKDTLELDSLDYVDLVVMIESNFGFKVNSEHFADITTFQHLYDYIGQRALEKA